MVKVFGQITIALRGGMTVTFPKMVTNIWTVLLDLFNPILKKRAKEVLPLTYHRFNIEKKNMFRNERHYGILTGMHKNEALQKYGESRLQTWRRSYDTPPPPLVDQSIDISKSDNKNDNKNDSEQQRSSLIDSKYEVIAKYDSFSQQQKNPLDLYFLYLAIPTTESLVDVEKRCRILWEKEILDHLKLQKNILMIIHGTSVRAMLKIIDDIEPKYIERLEIPSGYPIVYTFNTDGTVLKDTHQDIETDQTLAKNKLSQHQILSPIQLNGLFLGDLEELQKEQIKVKNQIHQK
ncbi:phosphoglycerate mutase [Reticulomyxa filosa]|uniref:phosphoglycerate mutase (2,3-diphosphoglycerate-dependent) n=1 Tax=Reticulomyxa filosa TaxID=46433 RepID=X6NAV6_RETFI|nr:phosphoglycerate mutase [Reticulomyxa filosa]|eukprot:ETO22447.1 phosphoglycerate mutase [Reticulomyxa filosa]